VCKKSKTLKIKKENWQRERGGEGEERVRHWEQIPKNWNHRLLEAGQAAGKKKLNKKGFSGQKQPIKRWHWGGVSRC